VKNLRDVTSADGYSWLNRTRDLFSGVPHRPGNYAIKYDSRHYSSASPFPLAD